MPGECFRVDLSPGETLLFPSGWIHGVSSSARGGPTCLVGGHFRHSLDLKVQFRLLQMEEGGDDAHAHCLRAYWQAAPKLRHDFSGFAGRKRMQGRIVNDGMQELSSNLQIWSFAPVKGVKTEKVLKELARDIKKCEKAMSRSDEEEEEEEEARQVNVKSAGLKLTISTGFASLSSSSSHLVSKHGLDHPGGADLTDRDSVKRLMSSATVASPSVLREQIVTSKPAKSASKKKKKEVSELDKELNSALMGFDLDQEEEDGGEERPFQVNINCLISF